MKLQTTNTYSLSDVFEHLSTGGTLDFSEYYEVEVEYQHETDKAWLFRTDAVEECWVPKSASYYQEGENEVDIHGWFLDKLYKEHN